MAPTPRTATHRLTIDYTVVGFAHKIHLYVAAYPSILLTSGWGLTTFSTDTMDAGAAADAFANSLKEYLEADDSINGWVLEEWSGAELLFKAAGSLNIVGTHSANVQRAGVQLTLFFRDTANKAMKIVISEPTVAVFSRYATSGAVPADIDAISDSMMDTAPLALGDWVRSRGNRQRDRFISVVGTLNRKLRRARGIA